VDRYYIEKFLKRWFSDVKGRVLEVGDNSYTRAFGADRVGRSDVLHVVEGNPLATFVGDLADAPQIPSDSFDCFILTQTLHLIYDFKSALRTVYRILKPGGVLLMTTPGITKVGDETWSKTWHWSFTELSVRKLLGEVFPPSSIEVDTDGNVLAAVAFLEGIAAEELASRDLDHQDVEYPVTITARAVKSLS
jgi:SAM-dependent methyltransferase